MEFSTNDIKKQLTEILNTFLKEHPQKKGSIFVIGCSSSEVCGGKKKSRRCRDEIHGLSKHGLFLACQCCEHLNRALVIEEECAQQFGYEPVCVVPWLHGGGSFATAAYRGFKNPVVVEHIKASAGLDIGDTLIGMHLKDVAVPVHPEHNTLGNAHIVAAWCRPKLIGGERAKYTVED